MTAAVEVEAFDLDDADELALLWFHSARDAHPYLPDLQALDVDGARKIFREHVLPGLDVWVLRDDEGLVAFLGLEGEQVDRLYVRVGARGRGWGRRLLAFAKDRHPAGLHLFTHQANRGARRFYEREGFVPVRFGISPPPESVPDVEYRWMPDS